MKNLSRIERYKATPEEVFQCLDDLGSVDNILHAHDGRQNEFEIHYFISDRARFKVQVDRQCIVDEDGLYR